MKLCRLRSLVALALSAGLLVACGSGTSSGADSAADTSSTGSQEWSGDSGAAAEPAGPNCEDGTCFVCGDGICPLGAYCATDAPSGPACAWLAECPGTPDCACIGSALGASCQCEMSDGGPSVSCN